MMEPVATRIGTHAWHTSTTGTYRGVGRREPFVRRFGCDGGGRVRPSIIAMMAAARVEGSGTTLAGMIVNTSIVPKSRVLEKPPYGLPVILLPPVVFP